VHEEEWSDNQIVMCCRQKVGMRDRMEIPRRSEVGRRSVGGRSEGDWKEIAAAVCACRSCMLVSSA